MSLKAEQQYRSWVEVDLDNFTCNLQETRRLIGPHVKILQVVKADAYGHGAIEISHVAMKNGAYCLGVANADEGVQLRVGGIAAPIVILSPSTTAEISEIIKYGLTPSVSDIFFARELQSRYENARIKAPIHVEIDTGMGRGGTMNHEGVAMIREIMGFPNVYIEGLFTHLSQSESMADSNERQWRLFQELLAELKTHNIYIPILHAANSGAVINFPSLHLDMVRPGLMTYGIYPSAETKAKACLSPVLSFKTRILLIKDFLKGSGIGYGSTFVTAKPEKIATIPVGYGDGYGFILSNRGEVLIREQRAPVVGRISMDMCTVNVSHITGCQVGDEVVMLGRQGDEEITADEIAARAGTISYEIICALGKRAPRVFVRKGRKDSVEPRLRRIFIPDEEKSISRIDDIIRRCFHARTDNEELGDAIYYTVFETLFGKQDRQLELRSHFKYDIRLEEFSPAEEGGDLLYENFFRVTTRVEYRKSLKNNVFIVGCAENDEQLAALLEDADCEYRWLLNSGGDLQAAKDFRIKSVRIDDEDIPLIRTESTARGYRVWCGGDSLVGKVNQEVKIEIEIETKKSKKSRDFSVYLVYPVRGLEINFNYGGTDLSNVREVAFFAGRHSFPAPIRRKDGIKISISDDEWVFPTSGVTFIWDYL